MTSKEALDELRVILFINYGTEENAGIFIKNLLKPIEKDLEVLEILKKHVSIFDTDPQCQYPKLIILSGSPINFEEAKIINRWLKNGK